MMSPTIYDVAPGDETAYTMEWSKKGVYDGMVKIRKRTDIPFLIIIVCMWIAMTVIGGIVYRDGDPNRLIAPYDTYGRLCGISADVDSKPYLYTIYTEGFNLMIFGTLDHSDP